MTIKDLFKRAKASSKPADKVSSKSVDKDEEKAGETKSVENGELIPIVDNDSDSNSTSTSSSSSSSSTNPKNKKALTSTKKSRSSSRRTKSRKEKEMLKVVEVFEVKWALRWCLFSSFLFFLGCACLTVGGVLGKEVYLFEDDDFWSDGDEGGSGERSPEAKILLLAGFGLFLLHSVPEISMDQPPFRPFGHGRYTRTSFKSNKGSTADYIVLNRVQTGFFAVATSLEIAAFYLMLYESMPFWYFTTLNLLASFFWLFSAALLLVTRGCCWLRCCVTLWDTCDQIGNGLYIVTCILWTLMALMQQEHNNAKKLSFMDGIDCQIVCFILWTIAATFYLMADFHRWMRFIPENQRRFRLKTRRKSIKSVDATPLTTCGSADDGRVLNGNPSADNATTDAVNDAGSDAGSYRNISDDDEQ